LEHLARVVHHRGVVGVGGPEPGRQLEALAESVSDGDVREGAEQRPVQVAGASDGVDDAVLGWVEPAQAGGDGDLLAFDDGAADLEAVEHAGGAGDVTGDGDVASLASKTAMSDTRVVTGAISRVNSS